MELQSHNLLESLEDYPPKKEKQKERKTLKVENFMEAIQET
jgi:hypothetical protein